MEELYSETIDDSEELEHYGTPRHSGRYPWGSGDDPFQHEKFYDTKEMLKKEGLSDTEIAKELNMSTTEYRALSSMVKSEKRRQQEIRAMELHEKGYSNVKIGQIMGINESSVRGLLDPTLKSNNDKATNAANVLKSLCTDGNYIDIGVGSEYSLGVSNTMLKTSVAMLKEEGYNVYYIPVEQLGTGKDTTVKVLAPPGVTYSEVYKNQTAIHPIEVVYSEDGDRSKNKYGMETPTSISSDRIYIRYGDEGGTEKDGVIELRRGVEDLSLGGSSYAQVRIAVDGTHYLKGMAMYNDDDIPDGYDVVYNSNKKSGTPKEKVFKELKDDPDNPFGATIKVNGQRHYTDADGNDKLSAINIVNEEGDWGEWSKTLASQMLSKQSMQLIKRQLNLSYADKEAEYEEIMALTNPTIKKKLLESFADGCDASAVDLKAASLPRQASHVILPITDMAEDEIYAPKYENGETVVLIRYPHGGTFEIPQLKVNNKQETAKKLLGNAIDAVGINQKVAEKLSGADFDGDTVLVIPCNSSKSKVKIQVSDSLKGLENFDTKKSYGQDAFPGVNYKIMSDKQKGQAMGNITNLITDMTLKGANEDELARAVRHSMVVIDAPKHKLNYEQSYKDNNIAELKVKYQGGVQKGASTLISKAKSPEYVNNRKDGAEYTDPETGKTTIKYIDPTTGKKLYRETGEVGYKKQTNKKTGEVTYKETIKKTKSSKMAEADDAFELSSGTPQEAEYANYANKLKALANKARLAFTNTGRIEYSPTAAKVYSEEAKSLNTKLITALKNAPRERQAQILANAVVKAKQADNPDMDNEQTKKVKGQALAGARLTVGAKKSKVEITDKEWEAIQAGAISDTKLSQILDNADLDQIKKLATPKASSGLSSTKIAQIKAKDASGYSISEIADSLGLSASTVAKYLKGGN